MKTLKKTDKIKYYLAMTGQYEFWDTTIPIIFLGPWCLPYDKKSIWSELEGFLMESPCSCMLERNAASDYVKDTYERILPLLAKSLNKTHGCNHSIRYWRIVLGPWLYMYISVIYDRYIHIKKALKLYPSLVTTMLSEECFVTLSSSHDFIMKVSEDSYNHQIYSRIFSFLEMEFQLAEINDDKKKMHNNLITDSWKRKFVFSASNFFCYLQKKLFSIDVVFKNTYFPILSELKLSLLSLGRIFLPKYRRREPCTIMQYDSSMREEIKKLSFEGDAFLKCLSSMLYFDVPTAFIEGYQSICEDSLKKYPNSVKVIFSSNSWYFDDLFKVWAAECAEKGTLLLGTPHGGNYGALVYMQDLEHELKIVDYYYTWGWNRNDYASKVIPMPATKLLEIKNIGANNKKNGVLWVATTCLRYLYIFPHLPILFNDYLSWQKIFLESFDRDLLPVLSLRAHYQDEGWGVVDRLKEVEEDLTVDTWDKPFMKSLSQSRLYVCDHLSTTFIEALAANKPTILFWNPDMNQLRVEAEPYFALLREQGILFYDPVLAANAVADVYDDVEKWWNNSDRQRAIKMFCNQFARTSPDAIELWKKEIHRVVDEAKDAS